MHSHSGSVFPIPNQQNKCVTRSVTRRGHSQLCKKPGKGAASPITRHGGTSVLPKETMHLMRGCHTWSPCPGSSFQQCWVFSAFPEEQAAPTPPCPHPALPTHTIPFPRHPGISSTRCTQQNLLPSAGHTNDIHPQLSSSSKAHAQGHTGFPAENLCKNSCQTPTTPACFFSPCPLLTPS